MANASDMIITGNNIKEVKSSRRKLIKLTEEVSNLLIHGKNPKHEVFITGEVDYRHGEVRQIRPRHKDGQVFELRVVNTSTEQYGLVIIVIRTNI